MIKQHPAVTVAVRLPGKPVRWDVGGIPCQYLGQIMDDHADNGTKPAGCSPEWLVAQFERPAGGWAVALFCPKQVG